METDRKRPRMEEEYAYPPIPSSDQDDDGPRETTYNDPFTFRRVPKTPSQEWGTGERARCIAASIMHVDESNENLIRTHHPALGQLETVWVSESVFGAPVWLVESSVERVVAAGRPIHLIPADYDEYLPSGILTPRSPGQFNILFHRDINPRKFLTANDLACFRRLFPRSIGVEILVAGYVIVLFEQMTDVEKAYHEIWPLELAGLRVFFDVARYECTTSPIQSGIGLSADLSEQHHARAGCLGLKLGFPDGTTAITTVTHGFVEQPCQPRKKTPMIAPFRKLYEKAKAALSRYRPAQLNQPEDPSYVLSEGRLTNSPIGKEVWLAASNRKIGVISHTYDRPSATKPYPNGYIHDLSLVTDASLPDVSNPPGYPRITGWANYSAALQQQPVYAVCHQTNVGRWRHIAGTADRSLYGQATILGTGYTWSNWDKSQNAFVLWHTENEMSPADGWSGSPLCLGSPSDSTSTAVVFQNFQRMSRLQGGGATTLVKAGFVLPVEIRACTILEAENNVDHKKYDTQPKSCRTSGESYRRSFSGV